jgi:hypothetical protein
MAGMLYYPLINPPAPVLNQALLYWDHIATIVPPGDDVEAYLHPEMREVNRAGLYKPVDASHWASPHITDEADAVLSHLSRNAPITEVKPGERHAMSDRAALYRSKLDYALVEILRRRNMATTADDAERVMVTPLVQTCLLGLVAREVSSASTREHGCTARESLIPHTDSSATYDMVYRPLRRPLGRRNHRPDYQRTPCTTIDLGPLLPVPRDDVLITDLLDFRHRYDDERRRLLLGLDRMTHELLRDYDHPDDVLRQISAELQDARNDVLEAGRSRRITWTRRSIALTVAVGGSYGLGAFHTAWSWLLGVAGGMATNVATSGEVRTSGAQTPLSYLHRVDKAIKGSGLPARTVRRLP